MTFAVRATEGDRQRALTGQVASGALRKSTQSVDASCVRSSVEMASSRRRDSRGAVIGRQKTAQGLPASSQREV